jgi:dienelactone hydrolase
MKRLALLALLAAPAARADEAAVKAALAKTVIPPRQTMLELQDFVEPRLPKLPTFTTEAEWVKYADKLRQDVLDRVVLRGEARAWAKTKSKVEYLGTLGGEGYKVRKLRFEAVPGMWIPALLYVPDNLTGKVPVALAVNGHDRNGKAAEYKQVRCVNLAKRGMIVLNVEWFGMGQLRQPGHRHGCMNQLDLCGTSGLAPFYLAMRRGLDVLLAQPGADAARLSVSGLSGGGWQTIFISALDPRVTLANPVAGYSGFKVRLRDHFKDLGDSEQTPVDLATLADYTHLTALRAPRPTLLTYNAKDDCCFEAGYALPPLLDAARPVFKLFGKEAALRSHVNHVPGTHNYEKENREVFYRMVGDFFFAGDKKFDAREIECKKEVRTADELHVDLPKDSASFNTLALALAKTLPRDGTLPATAEAAQAWQTATRKRLCDVVKATELAAEAEEVSRAETDGTVAVHWKLRLGKAWTVPVVELARGKPAKTAILLNDAGKRADPVNAERLLRDGFRVLAVDVFYFGEAKVWTKDWLFALLVNTVGERPLGVQASQLAAVARWSAKRHGGPAQVTAIGPRTSLIALTAAALEEKAIAGLELDGCRGSLKEVIESNRTVDLEPETFCFGLLETADMRQLAALAAPRPVRFRSPSQRVKDEMKDLARWYRLLGSEHDPLR